MNLIFFDDHYRNNLLPLTFTRPCSELRIGIDTIREKWAHYLDHTTTSWMVEEYLSVKFPLTVGEGNLLINGRSLPNPQLVQEIDALDEGESLWNDEQLIAVRLGEPELSRHIAAKRPLWKANYKKNLSAEHPPIWIQHVYDLFEKNSEVMQTDFERITEGRSSQPLDETVTVIGDRSKVFLERGGSITASILNTNNGPIYLAEGASIMEGCVVRGGLALGQGAQLKMAAKIYGAATFGPHCKVGGEVNNSILIGYSNKGHDGFLGNSVIGEWCNLGADTNTSNLKNNYGPVAIWDYAEDDFVSTGKQFCGLIMGDHSKSGINTMFNTGTVVGVCANVFDSGFPPKMIPSFAWGGAKGFQAFRMDKAFEVAQRMMSRRNIEFTTADEKLLTTVFEFTEKQRKQHF